MLLHIIYLLSYNKTNPIGSYSMSAMLDVFPLGSPLSSIKTTVFTIICKNLLYRQFNCWSINSTTIIILHVAYIRKLKKSQSIFYKILQNKHYQANLLKCSFCTLNSNLIISSITIQYPQIEVLYIQFQVWKYQLHSRKNTTINNYLEKLKTSLNNLSAQTLSLIIVHITRVISSPEFIKSYK